LKMDILHIIYFNEILYDMIWYNIMWYDIWYVIYDIWYIYVGMMEHKTVYSCSYNWMLVKLLNLCCLKIPMSCRWKQRFVLRTLINFSKFDS
jgi:hypothetical protein